MSIRQLEFRLEVLRSRIHNYSYDTVQRFIATLKERCKVNQHKSYVMKMNEKESLEFYRIFVKKMADYSDLVHLINLAVQVSTRIYHHAEFIQGGIKPVNMITEGDMYTQIMEQLRLLAIVHEDIFKSMPMVQVLPLVNQVFDYIINNAVVLVYGQIPTRNVVELTPDNLRRLEQPVANVRRAPSILPDAKTEVDLNVVSRRTAPQRPPSTRKVMEKVGSRISTSVLDDSGSMEVRIPSALAGKRGAKR